MKNLLILLVLFAVGCGGGVSKDQLELARLEAEKAKAEAEKARAEADKANASQSEQADGRPIGPPTFPPPPPPKTLQDFGKRIFAAYQSGNESELMGLTATIDDYEKWIIDFLTELGFNEIKVAGQFSTRLSEVKRTLFVAIKS